MNFTVLENIALKYVRQKLKKYKKYKIALKTQL